MKTHEAVTIYQSGICTRPPKFGFIPSWLTGTAKKQTNKQTQRGFHLRVESNSQFLWFCITTLCDWFKKLAPLSHLITSKTRNNRDSLTHVFQRFASATCTCICFEVWLVHCIICTLCDWLERSLWFRFNDTQWKIALIINKPPCWNAYLCISCRGR